MATKKTYKKLVRPKKNRLLGGVCIGLADYFNVDPTLMRLAWVLLLLPGGFPGIVPYVICWLVIPEE